MSTNLVVGDRLETKHLLSGRVKVQGFDLELVNPGHLPAPTFNDTIGKLAYDVAELPIAHYIVARDLGVPLIGIPVFPNVFYPLSGLLVNKGSGIKSPKDLAGKRIGVQGYANNLAAWLRVVLDRQYGVPPSSIVWMEGERDPLAGKPYPRPQGVRIEKVANPEQAAASGEIDGVVVGGGGAATDTTAPITSQPLEDLKAFYDSTGVFPINTMIVLKEETVAQQPGLAEALKTAFNETHAIYEAEEPDDGQHHGLPMGRLRQMGLFPRPHGLGAHGKSVAAIADFLHEEGLTKKRWTAETLFI